MDEETPPLIGSIVRCYDAVLAMVQGHAQYGVVEVMLLHDYEPISDFSYTPIFHPVGLRMSVNGGWVKPVESITKNEFHKLAAAWRVLAAMGEAEFCLDQAIQQAMMMPIRTLATP